MPAGSGRWGRWSGVLAGLPYDVQAVMFARLQFYNLDPAQVYRLPLLVTTPRLALAVGGVANSSFTFQSLTAVYGISQQFDNETLTGATGLTTPCYPSELQLQIQFNEGATTWLGSIQEPCRMGTIGDANHVTRVDPVIAARNDVWNVQITADATLANAVFDTVALHGVKFYNASGAI
jgi:hypothetical protein